MVIVSRQLHCSGAAHGPCRPLVSSHGHHLQAVPQCEPPASTHPAASLHHCIACCVFTKQLGGLQLFASPPQGHVLCGATCFGTTWHGWASARSWYTYHDGRFQRHKQMFHKPSCWSVLYAPGGSKRDILRLPAHPKQSMDAARLILINLLRMGST